MAWTALEESRFRERVDKTLDVVKTLLHNARTPELASGDHEHCYDDKFLLSVLLTNTALAGELNALNFLGLSGHDLRKAVHWAQAEHQTVTLRLEAKHKCKFVRMEKKKIEGPTDVSTLGKIFSFSSRVVTKQRQYIWLFSFRWSLVLFPGTQTAERVRLRRHSGACELTTLVDSTPEPAKAVLPPVDLDLTWLLRNVDRKGRTTFNIDRTLATCRTPRRNRDTDQAVAHFDQLAAFAARLVDYYERTLFAKQTSHDIQLSVLRHHPQPFVPVLPLFDFSQDVAPPAAAAAPPPPPPPVVPGLPLVVVHTSSSNLAASAPLPHKSPRKHRKSPRKHHKSQEGDEAAASTSSLADSDGTPRQQPLSASSSSSSDLLQSGQPVVSPRSGHRSPRQFFSGLVRAGSSSSSLVQRDAAASVSFDLTEDDAAPAAPAMHRSSNASLIPSRQIATLGPNGQAQVLLPIADLELFLAEQRRSLAAKFTDVAAVFPGADRQAITVVEGQTVVALLHCQALAAAYVDGVGYVEQMLYAQLVKAIGRQLAPADFANYMRFHNHKLFKPAYRLRGFAYAVRRPDHTPEGVLSIESKLDDAGLVASSDGDGSAAQPIFTAVRSIVDTAPMHFSLGAATTVPFYGTKYLHAWMGFRFAGDAGASLSLWARARQFSSFIVLLGRVHSPAVFAPEAAIVVHNRDELEIPLRLEFIPSAKQFRDATASLSPEQRQFAEAFRAMQLESTMFAVCVLEIKPQLERLLGLDADALTQEIELTDQLLELFMKYQIPSDLLRYQGDAAAPAADRLDQVRQNVQRVRRTVETMRKQELKKRLEERIARENARREERRRQRAVQNVRRLRDAAPVSYRAHQLAVDFDGCVADADMRLADAVDKHDGDVDDLGGDNDNNDEQDSEERQLSAAELSDEATSLFDFGAVPHQLNERFEQLDVDACVTPAIIRTGDTWRRQRQPSVLAAVQHEQLTLSEQKDEQKKAFDLIDSLSRCGSLPFRDAALHVVIANAHTFDKSIIDTVVQEDVNPIERVERSLLIVASVVQAAHPAAMIKDEEIDRLHHTSPSLFAAAPVVSSS